MFKTGLAFLCWLGIAGCASLPKQVVELPPGAAAVELVATPFFPQQAYQCGPAALNTVLVASGVDSSIDALVKAVYLPAKKGSLQAEMLAGARNKQRLPYRIDASIAAIHAEIAAGRPVLILQNLGVKHIPRWHYAVVVGVDPAAREVFLRSGTDKRRTMRLKTFMRTWQRSDFWGFVALRPGQIPANANANQFARTVAAMDSVGQSAAARASWQTAIERWPDNALINFAVAGIAYSDGNYDHAIDLYRRIIAMDPQHFFAHNNLAMAMAQQGQFAEARAAIIALLTDLPENDPMVLPLRQTIVDIATLEGERFRGDHH